MAETLKVLVLVHLHPDIAEVVIKERGRIIGKEPATVRFDFREELLFILLSAITAGDREIAPRIGFSAHFRASSTGRMNDLPQVICPLSSLISDFPKNISVPT
jgi:hypothetical protein